MFKHLFSFLLVLGLMSFWACETTSDPKEDDGIPADPTNVTVPPTEHDNITPSATFSSPSGNKIEVNLQGLLNPATDQPIELVADYSGGNYNFYLEEDGVLKGVKLSKVSTTNILKADVVFTVDNSGSMDAESDSIAFGIIAFADYLTNQGLDLRFGCVGYSGSVTGAINLTTASELENYLVHRTDYYGDPVEDTDRTRGFAGTDSATLHDVSYLWASGIWGENGVVGVLYADTMFDWHASAQRIYINFTDEPTQSRTSPEPFWNTAYMCSKIQGTASVHTVFSRDSSYYSWTDTRERPWDMSKCTGGTVLFISDDADSLNLVTLPVAGTLSNSYKVEFLTASATDSHVVAITIKVTDADGRIEFDPQIYGQQ